MEFGTVKTVEEINLIDATKDEKELLCKILNSDYLFDRFDLEIKAKVESIFNTTGSRIAVRFSNGTGTVYFDINKMQEEIRPGNKIISCEYCYSVYNSYDILVGYFYKEGEKNEL